MKLFLTFALILSLSAAFIAQTSCTTQEKAYVPYRDTVIIDRSASIVSAWDVYELKISDDSIYVYDAQELITALSSKEGGKIDFILRAENH